MPNRPRCPGGAPFRLALAASAAAHLAVGAAVESSRWSAPEPARAILSARLEPVTPVAPALSPVTTYEPDREKLAREAAAPSPAAAVVGSPPAVDAVAEPVPAGARLPADPRYYPAEEIDAYPIPLAPVLAAEKDGGTAGAETRVRLSLHIDELGVVNRLRVVEADPADAAGPVLALIAVTRFTPALRNGRAVRSHVYLEIRGAAGRSPDGR